MNAISPWNVVTDMFLTEVGIEGAEKIKQAIPMRDYSKPEDVADAVVFLASDRARLITGHSISVDGGVCLPVGNRTWDEYVHSHKEAVKKQTE